MNKASVIFPLLALALAGCSATSSPADYSARLSAQGGKGQSAQCRQMRAQAATYEQRERKLYWAKGALLGPYGLGVVAAGKDHQAKQRRIFMRDMHLACSNQPLPRELANLPPTKKP